MRRINGLLEGDLSNDPEFIAGIESVVSKLQQLMNFLLTKVLS